jgi:hypothetical protein
MRQILTEIELYLAAYGLSLAWKLGHRHMSAGTVQFFELFVQSFHKDLHRA